MACLELSMALLALLLDGRSAVAQATYTVFPAAAPVATTTAPQPIGHDVRVTLVVEDSTVAYAIQALTQQAKLHVLYHSGDPVFSKRIAVHLVNTPIMDALAAVLQGTGLRPMLSFDGETVLIRPQDGAAHAQGGLVAGRVTDSASQAGLGGVSVKIEGTKLRTVTSDSGHFTLRDVPPGEQVLSVRLFGYKPAERTVTIVDSERTTVQIAMVPVPTVLSGVVTTATGLQRKVEVGNDITTLNVDSIMRIAPITSVTDLLETRVPGLTVLHTSGVPGDPSRIRIRGASSITGNNDPIVIVDGIRVYANQSDPRNDNLAPSLIGGVGNQGSNQIITKPTYAAPSPLDQIDPNSIETIEVLKGPSATAIYGSDAANGVIVITTKRARAGPTHWDLALGAGVNWLPGKWPENYFAFGHDNQYLFYPEPNQFCPGYVPTCTVDSVVAFQALNDPRYAVFSHGSDQTASLTVSGGVPSLQYSLSGSGAGDIGDLKLPAIEQQRLEQTYGPIPGWMVRPDNYTNWGVNGQLTAQPTPAARVTLQSSLFNSNQQRSSLQTAITQLESEYINNGLLLGGVSLPGNQLLLSHEELLFQGEVERATDASLTSTNALTLSWQLEPWLPLTATAGLNSIQRTDQTYIPYGVNSASIVVTNGYDPPPDTTGYYGLGHGSSHNQTLTVGTSIPMHLVTLGLGGNVYSQSTADFNVYTNQLAPGVSVPTQFVTTNGTTVLNEPVTQTTTGTSTFGWYVEPRLNFASKFFVSPGFRLDGGSGGTSTTTSGGLGGLSAFPKIDLSYVAVDQSHPKGMLTLLRPRVAFGYAGTQPDPAQKLRLFNSTITNTVVSLDGTTEVPIVALSTLGNTQLRPETSRELEGGVDAELWHGRVSLTYTQYDKTRYNAIISIPVAPSVYGVQSIEENVGEIRNTGTEMTINTILFQNRTLSWMVGANLSNDNNVVVRLNPGFLPNKQLGIVAGYPLFGDWATPIVAFAADAHTGVVEPNDVVYGDSLTYVGQANPKYQFNVNTGITLLNGHLSINATFAYENGMTQNNAATLTSGALSNLWYGPGGTSLATQAAIVAASCQFGNQLENINANNCSGKSDIGFIQTVNTFRFNDLSINYTVPTALARWFRVPRMSVALQGSNLGLSTNYRGIDPDVNAFSTVSGGDETVDLGQLPEPRTWWLKLSLGQ